jgi:O-antigen ligase
MNSNRGDTGLLESGRAAAEELETARLLSDAKSRDPLGYRLHVAFAMLYLFVLPIATSAEGISFAILIVCALVRLRSTWPTYRALARDKVLWLFFITAVILGLSTLWIGDGIDRESAVDEGLTELKAFRVIALPLALWPVLEAAPFLIAAFLLGVFGLDLIQLAQRLNLFGLELQGADRARGLIHPIQSGAFNLAALTWYVAAILRVNPPRTSRGLLMVAGLTAGTLAATMGLIFAGSRGVWVAAIVALPLAWVIIALRAGRVRRAALLLLPAAAALALVLTAGGWRYALDRYEDARVDYRDAQAGDFTGSFGQRILMARWAWGFFLDSPIYGNGAGSFRELSRQTPEFAKLEERYPMRAENDKFTPAHPHNAYLHMLYATGILGGAVFALLLMLVAWRAWQERADHIFAGALFFVLLGWMIGTLSDCYTLNGHLFGLFGFIVALALCGRAKPPEQICVDAR